MGRVSSSEMSLAKKRCTYPNVLLEANVVISLWTKGRGEGKAEEEDRSELRWYTAVVSLTQLEHRMDSHPSSLMPPVCKQNST